ncbi:hypothetical protein [Brevibacillus borstelensis]|uniref:hypothetical protein n=1 Tax=Brevibacillus borstelensis TaxID=45462 RepID=UPI0012F8ADA8|nr:hypothetical protein [Brevibacillus borstelensis]
MTVLTDENGVQREYNVVEREANVGERIKIVDAAYTFGKYENGDVFVVDRVYNHDIAQGVEVDAVIDEDGNPDGYISWDEYVVIEPTSTVIVDGVRYREEKRKARVGERVLITNQSFAKFRNGTTGTVIGYGFSDNAMDVRGDSPATNGALTQHVKDYEYVVLTPKASATAWATSTPGWIVTVRLTLRTVGTAVADAVKAELHKREDVHTTVARLMTQPKPKSPQELRDEIVERAKADVAELERKWIASWQSDGKVSFWPKACAKEGFTPVHYVDFVVNREKRTVVALIKSLRTHTVDYRGVAKCAPGDVFNSHIGRAIALRRALDLFVPSEYRNAPQPTEVRVGDVVRGKRHGQIRTLTERLEKYDNHGYGKAFRTDNGMWLGTEQFELVDDSREEVSA